MPGLQARGTTFEYVERGSGAPVLFVHGSASDIRSWQAQVEAFASAYRAIAYSRRYHWPNPPLAQGHDYAMAEHVDDLRAIVQALGAAPAHLIGHSYGAFVVLLAAVAEPAIARSLTLVEPPVVTLFVGNRPRVSELASLALRRPRTAMAIVKFGATGVAPATAAARRDDLASAMRIFGRAVLGDEHYRRLSPSRLEQVAANAIKAEFTGSGFPRVAPAAIERLRVPTLLVEGNRSPAIFHRIIDRLEELLPLARRAAIPDASHVVHEDNPAIFNETVLSFLAHPQESRH